ncbi:MAG: hypothetical protein RLZZ15_1743 [Verrucomicrobiota bacterium]
MSWLKFGTFDGSPFQYSVQYTAARRAAFDNRNFHVANLDHNVDAYFLRPNFHLEPHFPWVALGSTHGRTYPGAKIDLAEPTLGLPFAMPALFALAVAGGGWAWLRAPALRVPLALTWLAVLPMAAALLAAIVTSHRYTADFCPWLIAGAALALAVLDAEAGWRRPAALGLAGALTAISVAVTLALALRFQGAEVWGVPAETKARYQAMRATADRFFGVTAP